MTTKQTLPIVPMYEIVVRHPKYGWVVAEQFSELRFAKARFETIKTSERDDFHAHDCTLRQLDGYQVWRTLDEHSAPERIDVSRIVSVYSGKRSACMCGCSGKHTYASKFRAEASKSHGYAISDDDVSDRTVALICAKIQKLGGTHVSDKGVDYWHADTPTRSYVAYVARTPR